MRPSLLTLVFLAAITVSTTARADRQEWYVIPTLSPELLRLSEPTSGASYLTKPTIGFGLTGYYGLTDELHLGAELHYTRLANVPFSGTTIALTDGSTPTGTLYADNSLFAITAVAVYRFDMRGNLVPIVRLGVGPAFASYGNLALFPRSTQLELDQPSQSEIGFTAQVQVGVQYRIGNHLAASAAVEVRRNLGLHVPWEFELPLAVGYVW